MSKKGFDFRLEVENVKDNEEFNNNTELINEIKKIFKETPFPLDGAGFCENREFLIISGQVCRDSKKEAQAEYIIFKEKLLRIFKRFYKKVRLIDIFIAYFTTLH